MGGGSRCMARWSACALLALAATAGCSPPERRVGERFSASGELIALSGGDSGASNACFTCHGLDGGGNGAVAPRLAGLDRGYLVRQLDDFAAGRRRHPDMEFIARRLSPSERQMVSAYYAAMPRSVERQVVSLPPPPLYLTADPARGLPACASCHGEDGAGVGYGNPPLAGQPAPYLAAQLEAWRSGTRRGDAANLMQHISRRLTPDEIRSLAAYAAALPGASPRPESREASREARRGGSRNGA